MNKLRILAASLLVLGAPHFAQAATLFTTPVILVSPKTLDFGRVATKTIATNTFLVQNIGKGTLVGKATVALPFKILSGGDYSLRDNEAQVITVTYKPTAAALNTQTVQFRGGGGAKVIAAGK